MVPPCGDRLEREGARKSHVLWSMIESSVHSADI
jgi:hypothetical protein